MTLKSKRKKILRLKNLQKKLKNLESICKKKVEKEKKRLNSIEIKNQPD